MNVLIVGGGSWDDTTSLGNTFSNFFSNWKDAKFYNLYFREVRPNNSVCTDYFRITTKEILKKYFTSEKIGNHFELSKKQSNNASFKGDQEKKMISIIHRLGLKVVYELEDWLWYSKKWLNKTLDDYIEYVKPDVIFTFAAGNSYIVLPIEYIKAKTRAKLILLVADDMHTTYRLKRDRHHRRMCEDFDKLIKMSDKVYGISEEMCSYYNKLYGIDVAPLYKGCSFENQVMSTVNDPIKLVYAGNLLFGRYNTILSLIDCLKSLTYSGINVVLDIYSGTIITDEQRKKLNQNETSYFHGQIEYSEVKQKMTEADIVIHVESFDQEQIEQVRYSFSTKIIDCLQSGSVLLAIGPDGISSIEYSKRIPGAVVIGDMKEINNKMSELLSEGEGLVSRANRIREFALKNHCIDVVRDCLQKDFRSICGI